VNELVSAPACRYDAVFFDLGYTLIWFSPSVNEIAAEAWRAAGLNVTVEQVRTAMDAAYARQEATAGAACFPASEEYDRQVELQRWRDVLHLLGGSDESIVSRYEAISAELYRRPGVLRLYDDVLPVLAALQRAGCRLGIISNWNWSLNEWVERAGLTPFFEVVVGSAYAGCQKPHPAIFQRALERMDVPAQRAVYVGDRYETDVVGARAAGLAAILLDRAGQATHSDCATVRDLWGALKLLMG